MNRWYARRHWIALGCLVLLALDAALYFGWVRRPVSAPELISGPEKTDVEK